MSKENESSEPSKVRCFMRRTRSSLRRAMWVMVDSSRGVFVDGDRNRTQDAKASVSQLLGEMHFVDEVSADDVLKELESWPQCREMMRSLFANGRRSLRDIESLNPIRNINLRDFSRINRDRCESPQGFGHALMSWTTSDWFTATLGELGEAANVAKKLNRVRDGINGNTETPEQLREKLRRELADTFIYLDLLAQACDIDLTEAVVDTFNAKSDQIGYGPRLKVGN